jgi:hypothetical protein
MATRNYDPIGALNGLFAPPHIAGDPQAEAAVGAWNAAHIPGPAQFAAPFAAGRPASMAGGAGLFAPPYVAGDPTSTAAVEAFNARRNAVAQQLLQQAYARQQAAQAQQAQIEAARLSGLGGGGPPPTDDVGNLASG